MKYPDDHMHELKTQEGSIKELLREQTPIKGFPNIKNFYAGREIFITGGSGFIGKVLIEKLLRSCPDIKLIYILIRPKRGESIEERLNKLVELKLFDAVRKLNPNFASKLVPIAGDVAELKLGLSNESIQLLRNVSIIFHSAATVRFDDSLKYAVLMNTRGTRELMEFATTLVNLKVLMHVSTTYSNVYTHTLEEKLYPPAADWRKTIEICEKMDEDQLDKFTQHYINFMPNTYVFSKNLAEHVSNDYKNKLPIVLFRPSVVIWSQKEPFPGWVDSVNGPMGILLVSVLGLSKTMYCDPKNVLDMMPVDVIAKAMIMSAWKRGSEANGSFPIYNSAAGNKNKLTIRQMLEIGIHGVCKEVAPQKTVLTASGGVTLCKSYNFIRLILFQILPALFFDFILRMKMRKPKLMKIQRKMFEANKALSYFVTHNWNFINENFCDLNYFLHPEDVLEFDFRTGFTYDSILFIRYSLLGFRRYLLHEKDESLPKGRRRYQIMKATFDAIYCFIFMLAFYIIFFKYDIVKILKNSFGM